MRRWEGRGQKNEFGSGKDRRLESKKIGRWECGMGNERAESMGRKKLGRSNLIQLN